MQLIGIGILGEDVGRMLNETRGRPREPGDGTTPDGSRVVLGVILAAAVLLRLAWWAAFVDVLENEGVVYARLAENLFSGEGYTGIFGGRDVAFPPLFPMLIGLVAMIVGSEELAARLIGLLCGTALVGVLYTLTRYMFNTRAALVAAALAAAHPLLIALSVSMYSEGPWVFLVVCAAYAVVRSFAEASTGLLVAAGLISGAAYLVRPEGMGFVVYFAIAMTAVGVLRRRRPIEIARTTGIFLAATLILALPYIVYLSSLTGSFRWEGKSVYTSAQNVRVRAGMTVQQATRGLNADGSPDGSFLTLHLDQASWLRTPSAEAPGLVDMLLTSAGVRARRIARLTLSSGFISAPWIFPLVVIGVVCTPWWRRHPFAGVTLMGVSALHGLLLFAVDQAWSRYFFGLLPLFLMWSAAGIEWMATVASMFVYRRSEWQQRAAGGVCLLGAAALALAAVGPVRRVGDLGQAEDRVSWEIGQWMAQDARRQAVIGRPIVMGIFLNATYYAGGTMRYLPYASEETALAYVHRMQPHYLIVRESDVAYHQMPYAGVWLSRGIPDSCAVLARDEWTSSPERARVWRWTCGPAAPAPVE